MRKGMLCEKSILGLFAQLCVSLTENVAYPQTLNSSSARPRQQTCPTPTRGHGGTYCNDAGARDSIAHDAFLAPTDITRWRLLLRRLAHHRRMRDALLIQRKSPSQK